MERQDKSITNSLIEYQGKELDYSYLYVDWQIGEICNFSCSYCFQRNNKKNRFYPSIEQVKNAIEVINSFGREHVDVSIAGGESTLCLNFKEILRVIVNNVKNVRRLILYTNGSKPLDYFEDLFSCLPRNCPLYLYMSIHPEHVSSISLLYEKMFGLSRLVKNYQPAILFKKTENVHKIIEMVDHCFIHGLNISPKLVFVRGGEFNEELLGGEYTPNDIEYCVTINQVWEDPKWENRGSFWEPLGLKNLEHNYALKTGLLNFNNMYCCHGATSLWIHNDGTCSGTICRSAKYSKFSIYDGINPYLMKDYLSIIRCPSKLCGCKDNLMIPKFRARKDAENYLKSLSF